jgi:hypothetical protein
MTRRASAERSSGFGSIWVAADDRIRPHACAAAPVPDDSLLVQGPHVKPGRELIRVTFPASAKKTVEPVYGQIKHHRRIDRFMRRGRAAAWSEWRLVAATHNLLKLHSHWIANSA